MHELSVMGQVVESIGRELEGKAIVRVESVRLEVGELTMLGKEQLRFAWGILTKGGPLKGARLIIVGKPAVIECGGCGYKGGGRCPADPGSHLLVPILACPKCGGEVRIVGGRECIIRSLKAMVNDGEKGPGARGRGMEGRGPGPGARGSGRRVEGRDWGHRSSPGPGPPAPGPARRRGGRRGKD